ncbi:sterol O-acyltransferase [Ceratobasidium sp. AG-Ba]|nr:sterol O-acyltransferase [Ceratobasidium sp. AG-Ba]
MSTTSTSTISKGGSDIQTQDGTIHVQPYRQANSKQLRAVISFTPRASAFEASGSDPFRGFYSLFWISMFLLLLRTYVNNFYQNGYPLSMVFATLFTRDAFTLAISDGVLFGSTFICVPFVQAIQKGYIRYYWTGQIILHIYQAITLGLAIKWTFNREWPWVQSGFFTLHTLVMLMKTYSYVATNGYLADLSRTYAATQSQLEQSIKVAGGYEVVLAQANEANERQETDGNQSAPDTRSVTPVGTPPPEREESTSLRKRLVATNGTNMLKKEDNVPALPLTSSYVPGLDVPPLPLHPLTYHPAPSISTLAQSLNAMDTELTSTGKNRVRFPTNLTYANFLDFQFVPTLCYELEYPRTDRIRPMYVFEKTVATFGTFTLLYTITEHYIMPLIPTSEQSFWRSMVDLALPFMLSYLILFYIIFECICNGFAELSCFGDREFYQDWWNSTSFDEYARKWNKPVHAFLLRHVYQASLSSKRVSRFSATFITFLLSALVHELVMAVVTKKIRMYLFILQMSQIPLIFVGRLPIIKRNRVLGNVFFWVGLMAGFPLLNIPLLRVQKLYGPRSFAASRGVITPTIRTFSATKWRLQNPKTPPSDGPHKKNNSNADKPTLRENIYTIPNALTASRILACPVLGWSILEGRYGVATGLLLYAGVTDWVDGYIARKWNMRTVLGTILDPAADKTLMTTLTVTLAMKGLLPVSLAVIILGRDVLLSISAFYYRYISLPPPKTFARYWDFSIPSAEVRPTDISKLNTALQLGLMGVTTVAPILPMDLSLQLMALQLTVAVTTVWSGLSYVFSKDAVKILTSNKPSFKQ